MRGKFCSLHLSEHGNFTPLSNCSHFQVSELLPRLSRIQSDSRKDTPLARPQPNAREAAAQRQPEHQPQETAGPSVQLVSNASSPAASGKWILHRALEAAAQLSVLFDSDILFRTTCVSQLVPLFVCLSVTTRMKIISLKHSQPSPPRAQQSRDLAARWTDRYSHLSTHR